MKWRLNKDVEYCEEINTNISTWKIVPQHQNDDLMLYIVVMNTKGDT